MQDIWTLFEDHKYAPHFSNDQCEGLAVHGQPCTQTLCPVLFQNGTAPAYNKGATLCPVLFREWAEWLPEAKANLPHGICWLLARHTLSP
jgi:hypothetical protein